MTSHPDLQRRLVNELRADLGAEPQQGPAGETANDVAPHITDEPKTRRAKRAARRVAGPAWHRFIGRIADATATRLRTNQSTERDRLAVEDELMHVEVELVHGELNAFRAAVDALPSIDEVQSLTVNLELMKGELGAFHQTLEDLGRAISPGAGIDGVPRQFAELRTQINALDRRLRTKPGAIADDFPAGSAPDVVSTDGPGFDYVGFEHRFRGDPDEILARTEERYLELLTANQPVLDIGCGRGELLAGLAARGVRGEGVDLDAEMIAEARARGVEAHLGDALEFLRATTEGSYGSICAIQVVEHLHIRQVVELLDLAATRLRPGGVLIAETPNPTSMIVLSRSYILDPTHVWPLHPSLLTFLCERAGFLEVEERFFGPAEELYLPMVDAGDESPPWVATVNQAFTQLNQILFGPQDYAIVASTPDE